jgi:hypothetical protein
MASFHLRQYVQKSSLTNAAKGAAALYHLRLREPVARVELAEANEQRDWRLWQDPATGLIKRGRHLYAGEDLGLDLDETIYALDSTTIDLSLQLFPWAEFRSTKAGVKLHTQLDPRGPIPVQIEVRAARSHDVLGLDALIFEPGAFYLLDRAYMDFTRLATRLFLGRCDASALSIPTRARSLVFLTNHLEVSAATVAALYKNRWQIELFFRWIKQHLRIKHFFGTSPNAVKTQV